MEDVAGLTCTMEKEYRKLLMGICNKSHLNLYEYKITVYEAILVHYSKDFHTNPASKTSCFIHSTDSFLDIQEKNYWHSWVINL